MKDGWIWKVVPVAAVVAAIGFVLVYGLPEPAKAPVREGGDVGGLCAIPENPHTSSCGSLGNDLSPEQRVEACLASVPAFTPSKAAKSAINDIEKGQVLVAGDVLDVKAQQVPLAGSPLVAVLVGTDEKAAAKALRDAGIRGFAIHRDLTSALDRDRRVLARLANHDFLEWFQLRYVAEDLLFYTVRGSESRLSDATGAAMVGALRSRLEGRVPARQVWKPDSVRLIVGVRLKGQTLVLRHAAGDDLEKVLDDAANKVRRRWERDVEITGAGTLDERLDDLRIDVHVVLERATVEPRDRWSLFDLWEMGIDGAIVSKGAGDNATFAYMPGAEAVAHSHKCAQQFLTYTLDAHEVRERRLWERADVDFDLIRDEHFMEAHPGGGDVVRMMRGMPTVSSVVEDAQVRDMLTAGGHWWMNNQYGDGSFVYKYWPEQNRLSSEYNEVRHILAARDLAAAYRWHQDPRFLTASRKSMDWLLNFEVNDTDRPDPQLPSPPAGSMLFRYPARASGKLPNQKLGTVAVALLGWLEWAKQTGSHEEDERIRRMAKFVVSQQNDNGKFEPYFVPVGHPYFGQKNDIVPGEAALALGQVAEYFNEPVWVESFPKFLDFYEPWFRERAVREISYGRWPMATYTNQDRLDLVQFGPWSVMASGQYYRVTGDERAAKFGMEVADWMIDSYQWTSDRAPWPDYVGGYYKLPDELPAMQTFCYSEGTAAAYRIAIKAAPERKAKYAQSTSEAIRFMRLMQYDDVDSYAAPRDSRVLGGVKYAMNEGKIRIDYVGHALSTLAQYLDAREIDPEAGFALVPEQITPDALIEAAAGDPALPDVEADEDESQPGE